MKQTTLKQECTFSGIGLHSGHNATIAVLPAPEDHGIVFYKEDRIIPARVEEVVDTRRGTTLGGIIQVEHLLAAINGLKIDNLMIKVVGDEIPVLDGSALEFVKTFTSIGMAEQNKEKNFLELRQTVHFEEDGKSISAAPFDGFRVDFMVNFSIIGPESFEFKGTTEEFIKEIAPARTFGYQKELEALQRQGLAKGASLENALAIGEKGFLNQPRFPDEPVRHKVLDIIGDLALLGKPLKAKITAKKTGHTANIELVRRILCSI
ncbi:MAG: UDP-3-O-acyl-N-acetylglucosamine deacetylase [Candidatus Margulisiibacteriota bacterium]